MENIFLTSQEARLFYSINIKLTRSRPPKRQKSWRQCSVPLINCASDRGIEFQGSQYQSLLKRHELKHSLNRPYHCTDNACMESFYHSLKAELIRSTKFINVNDLRTLLAKYINNFYNSVRLHSSLDYESPMEYEQRIA